MAQIISRHSPLLLLSCRYVLGILLQKFHAVLPFPPVFSCQRLCGIYPPIPSCIRPIPLPKKKGGPVKPKGRRIFQETLRLWDESKLLSVRRACALCILECCSSAPAGKAQS